MKKVKPVFQDLVDPKEIEANQEFPVFLEFTEFPVSKDHRDLQVFLVLTDVMELM